MNYFPLFSIGVLTSLLMLSCTTEQASKSQATITSTYTGGQALVKNEVSEINILQVALQSSDHSTLVAAVEAAEMAHVLTNAGPLTVFAPTNEAFAKLPEGTLDRLMKQENKAELARIIPFHAAPGSYGPDNIRGVMGIGQATGDQVKVLTENGQTTVNGATVLGSVKASNGYVHVIDAVLLPPEKVQ